MVSWVGSEVQREVLEGKGPVKRRCGVSTLKCQRLGTMIKALIDCLGRRGAEAETAVCGDY